jgi:hypothetical protein
LSLMQRTDMITMLTIASLSRPFPRGILAPV